MARRLLHEGTPAIVAPPIPLANGFALFWDRFLPSVRAVPVLQMFDEFLRPLGDAVDLPFQWPSQYQNPRSYGLTFAAVSTPQGFALLSEGLDRPPGEPGSLGVYLYFVGFQGQVVRERVRVNEKPSGNARLNDFGRGGLTVDDRGNLVVAFTWGPGTFQDDDVYVRRFSSNGVPLGPQIRANTFTKGMQQNAEVAALPDGRFLVVWQSAGQDGADDGIYGRLFSAQGRPLGREFRVNEVTLSAQQLPWVVADGKGRFFVGWQSDHPFSTIISSEIKGRFFGPDGKPLSSEFHVNQDRLHQQERVRAAFTLDGTLFTVWQSASSRQTRGQDFVPVARRFSVPDRQEP